MTWLVILLASSAVFGIASMIVRGRQAQRRCPTCHVDYEVVAASGSGPNQTYDVLACPRCSNTATLVHGARTHLAYCPACTNRALETSSHRATRGNRAVDVAEHCHLCGFERSFTVGASDAPLGRVIPFPTQRTPRPDTGSEPRRR